MTAAVAPFPRARPERWPLAEVLVFAAAVLMLLIYSEAWETPLTGGADEPADSALIRTLFLPSYAIAVGLMALTPWRLVQGLVRQPFLIALMAIATASWFWSVAPDQTERRIFALVFTSLSGVVLAARYSWARLAELVAATFAILAVACLLAGLFLPSVGRMTDIFPGAWRGLWPEKNAFGGMMTMGAGACAAAALLNPHRRRLWWGMALLCFLMVLMSTSKTSLVSALLGGGALLLVGTVRRGPAAGVAASWIAVVGLTIAGVVLLFASGFVLALLGKDATLTGRTELWGAILRQIDARPWLGYGYGAIWDETDRFGPLAWITHDAGFRAYHAHNAWLEQWLTMGVIGLAAWAGCFLQALGANVVALYRDKGAYLALPFFVVYALMTLTESVAVQYNDMRWVLFVAMAAKLALPDPAPAVSGGQSRRALRHRHRLEPGLQGQRRQA